MDQVHQLMSAVAVVIVLYIIAVILRKRGVLEESNTLTLAALVTDVFLPATVFKGLSTCRFQMDQLEPAAVMVILELSCISLAWVVSRLLGFSREKQGAVVFASAFGSSTFLGYSIIMQIYPGNGGALDEAVLISEIGVGYPIFILGPILASHFGSGRSVWRASLGFFRSPVFFALIGGILWSGLSLPGRDSGLAAPLFHLLDVLSAALTPVAIITVGLMLRKPEIRKLLLPLAVVVGIKLLLKPIMAGGLSHLLGFSREWRDILVILAAMPPAVLGVVFLKRYGGDARLASTLLLAATILSCATVVGVFWLAG